jgi:predicted nuclease of predicted toxin-antitoxin system
MKLLFDHHLSRKLVARLADIFPNSSHVAFHGLDSADDINIWHFAQGNGYTIVTKDSDFNDVAAIRGAPPKIIWIRIGNSTNATVEAIIRKHFVLIEQFGEDSTSTILEIV